MKTLKTTSAVVVVGATLLASSVALAQPGRYASRYGIRPASLSEGTTENKLDEKPYTASYLPRTSGPLANDRDKAIDGSIKDGFQDGKCNLIHERIKANLEKSSAEKFDTAVSNAEGRSPGLKDEYLREGYNPNAEGWEGFCHLWAPAGLDPVSNFVASMDRIYADVPMGIGDLRELNTYLYPMPNAKFFGKRNYSTEPESDNLDPADLLAIFENYVGPGKPGVVFDVDPGVQVWNQPMYSWKKTATEIEADATEGLAIPEGGKAFKVNLTSEYGVEANYAYRGEPNLSTANWNFIAVTDASGKIVGTKWTGYNKIPDFAWVPDARFDTENYKRLQKIAKEGIPVSSVEKLCATLAGLPNGEIPAETLAQLKALLAEVCPILDSNKVDEYVKTIAAEKGIDYSILDAALNNG